MEICPNCQQPVLHSTTTCPHCSTPILHGELNVILDREGPDSAAASGRGVAVAGDLTGTVITGDIGGDVTINQVIQIEIPPPPPPDRPPQAGNFVGREAELEYFSAGLTALHLAVITGMPGVGKTALAVRLAQQAVDPYRLFWYSFHLHEGVEDVVFKLAAFLAWGGQDDLWRMLNRSRQLGGKQLSWGVIFDYLLEMLRGKGYVLCLDDFHLADDQSLTLLETFLGKLREALKAGEISIILTSRSRPNFARLYDFEPLGGLSLADTRKLVAAGQIRLTDDQISRLHLTTAGNAQFLTLALQALQKTADPARMISRLAESENLEDYLLDEVDQNLSASQRQVMSAVAVLLGYPGTRNAIEALLEGESTLRSLQELSDQHLLTTSEGKTGREYGQHAILRAFYYDLLSTQQRQAMHHRAGQYYAAQEIDLLKAGLHFERAGEKVQAASVATSDVRSIINQGQARVFLRLIERFSLEEIGADLWARVCFTRGQLYALLGEGQLARESYAIALQQTHQMSPSPEREAIEAGIHLGMGEMLLLEDPQQARDWLQRGLVNLKDVNPLKAALLIKLGYIDIHLGDYALALDALQQGLAHLPEGPSPLRSNALSNLSVVHYLSGHIQESQRFIEEALKISQELDDDYETASNLINLGILKYSGGDWQSAILDFQRALTIADSLGSLSLRVSVSINLGAVYCNLGVDQAAGYHLNRALELARKDSLHLMEALALFRLAELYNRQGETANAAESLAAAEALAKENEDKSQLAAIYSLWAENALAEGRIPEAQAHIEQSLSLAEELGEDLEQGISLRVLGQVLIQSGECARAAETLERSLSILENSDVYEAARARFYYALAVRGAGDSEKAAQLMQSAGEVFQKLGARREIELFQQRQTA